MRNNIVSVLKTSECTYSKGYHKVLGHDEQQFLIADPRWCSFRATERPTQLACSLAAFVAVNKIKLLEVITSPSLLL